LAGKPENIFVGPDSADALVKALGVCSEDKKEQNGKGQKKVELRLFNFS
jgi:hypothetical protein